MESKRAQNATRKLQGSVRRVARTCNDINDRMGELETRTVALEADMSGSKGQVEVHEDQLVDIQWKLEEAENRQRRNNLRFLGIPEGKEGGDVRLFMAHLM